MDSVSRGPGISMARSLILYVPAFPGSYGNLLKERACHPLSSDLNDYMYALPAGALDCFDLAVFVLHTLDQ